MFTKKETKEFIIKFGKRVFFPDVSNRMSQYVMIAGAAIIVGMNPYSIIIMNWLVDVVNKNNTSGFSLPHFSDERIDYIWGVAFIFIAMIHNIIYQWIKFSSDKIDKELSHIKEMAKTEREERFKIRDKEIALTKKQQVMEVDREQFVRFIDIFSSDSLSAELLKNHNFWGSYHEKNTEQLDNFVARGITAETRFLDDGIDKAMEKLWNECRAFSNELVNNSNYIGNGSIISIVPPGYAGAFETPEWLDERIKKINCSARKCYELHQEFILLCRKILNN